MDAVRVDVWVCEPSRTFQNAMERGLSQNVLNLSHSRIPHLAATRLACAATGSERTSFDHCDGFIRCLMGLSGMEAEEQCSGWFKFGGEEKQLWRRCAR